MADTGMVMNRSAVGRGMTLKEQKLSTLRLKLKQAIKQAREEASSQIPAEDPFTPELYRDKSILVPPYSPSRLYSIYEQSSILPKCVQAMVDNVPGFGVEYMWHGDGEKPTDGDDDLKRIKSFMKMANEEESFMTLRKELRRDQEVTGNWYTEVVRSRRGDIMFLYRAKSVYMRLCRLDQNPTETEVLVERDGTLQRIRTFKRFRRFVFTSNGKTLKWFKQFGDPRTLDATTGEYTESPKETATEIIHCKIESGSSSYGIPRWIGNARNVLGVLNADTINYDLFTNQGIPPIVVMVSGGILTAGSIDELEALLMDAKGVENFNKIAILEAEETGGEIDQYNRSKIDIKPLTDYRKEDLMFEQYIGSSDERTRQAFRLPPVFVGSAEEYTYASVKTSRLVAEEQVFKPERKLEDEKWNVTVFAEIENWSIATKGPEITRADDLINLFNELLSAGALTINIAISIANKLFELEIPEFTQVWASYPIGIVMEFAKQGQLAEVEDLMETPTGQKAMDAIEKVAKEAKAWSTKKEEFVKGLLPGEQKFYHALSCLDTIAGTLVNKGNGEDTDLQSIAETEVQ